MSSERRRLLIVGGGIEQVRAYELARELGLETVGSDRDPGAPALAHADHALVADTHDAEATIAAARQFHEHYPIHGVMTIAHDVPHVVARVAAALDLPHLPLEAADLAVDKLAMKERFQRDGVAVPRFRRVATETDVRACIAEWGLPIVTKPIDSCGARGVWRVTSEADAGRALAAALDHSRRGVAIAEDFVEGVQLSTEGIAWRGRTETVSWSVRNYDRLEEFAPFVIEDGGVLPAELAPDEEAAVRDVMDRAARSLGIDSGPVKGDLVLTPDGPVVIELAARLSGGYLCTDQIPWARGVDLVRQTIKLALGEDLNRADLVPEHRGFVGVRFFFPEPGVVEEVEGFDELADEPWILKRALYVGPGDTIEPTTSHPTRAGFVFATADTADEAEARARSCVERVRIRTRPRGDGG